MAGSEEPEEEQEEEEILHAVAIEPQPAEEDREEEYPAEMPGPGEESPADDFDEDLKDE